VRARAFDDLKTSGPRARVALRAAQSHVSEEVRMRVAELLSSIGGADDFRIPMLVEMLGMIGTPQSRALLTKIASQNLSIAAHAAAVLAREK